MTARVTPTPLEIAAGRMIGLVAEPVRPLQGDPGLSPLDVLEEAVVPALERPPCLVSFSGGRDSSAVLAIAARSARRRGLPLPMPVTLRFPEAPTTDERLWQERVIGYLDLEDWVRVDVVDELDVIGPVSASILRRLGLVWPITASLYDLLLRRADGGSLLLGLGGDAVLGGWQLGRLRDVAARRARPRPSDLLLAGYAVAPTSIRRAVRYRWRSSTIPWLRPEALEEVRRRESHSRVLAQRDWVRYMTLVPMRRSLVSGVQTVERLAADANALVSAPLTEGRFLAALARLGGRRGIGGRTAVMEAIFDDALPRDLLSRPDKAVYDDVYFRGGSRAFAREWEGSGVDPALVDHERLRGEWLAPIPRGDSALALQAAWLAAERAGAAKRPATV
jgi:Asparagine synthase